MFWERTDGVTGSRTDRVSGGFLSLIPEALVHYLRPEAELASGLED